MKWVIGTVLMGAYVLWMLGMLAHRAETSPAAVFAVLGLTIVGTIMWVYTVRRWRRYV